MSARREQFEQEDTLSLEDAAKVLRLCLEAMKALWNKAPSPPCA
jgi:hypothetical protein